MPWLILILAGLLEIVWAVGLKASQGFTRLWPSVWTIVGFAASFALLARAMKSLPLGTAYTVWTGIGAVGSVIAGVFLFNEGVTWPRMVCIIFILGGIVGLKLTTP
ncbi:MAG: multidrug efflux SMR transporter [Phycisphaeraceae bacterium]|nr:multidrug efflux SMR transporter [Phycisphaeraceae bacterium]